MVLKDLSWEDVPYPGIEPDKVPGMKVPEEMVVGVGHPEGDAAREVRVLWCVYRVAQKKRLFPPFFLDCPKPAIHHLDGFVEDKLIQFESKVRRFFWATPVLNWN